MNYNIQAAYHFKQYARTYPLSEFAEDALFMSAYCNYLGSPIPSLDQEPTYKAIDELQVFVNTYPKSPLVDSANHLVDELQLKLETKDFENSKQYYKIKQYKDGDEIQVWASLVDFSPSLKRPVLEASEIV